MAKSFVQQVTRMCELVGLLLYAHLRAIVLRTSSMTVFNRRFLMILKIREGKIVLILLRLAQQNLRFRQGVKCVCTTSTR